MNLADARAFLDLLGSSHTFQSFDDTKAKRPRLNRILHGTLDEHGDALARLNDSGAGVFVMANQGDGKGRKTANVVRVRAVFLDLDGAPLEPVQAAPLPPHCIVETSPSRWHCWWIVADCPLESFTAIQKALARRFSADPSVSDLARVMRLPGFVHRKASPFLSRVVELHHWPARTLREMEMMLGTPSVLPQVISEGERNNRLFTAATGLVQRGHARAGVADRLKTINAERCKPPLPESEVDQIVANAAHYGSQGFMILPHRLYDSQEWRSLDPAAQVVVLEAFRRFDGRNNGRISLTWADFGGRKGFAKSDTYYRARAAACEAGFLAEVAAPRLTQRGRIPSLFAIPERWLHNSANPKKWGQRKPQNLGSYIDKQSLGTVAVMDSQNAEKGAAA